MREITAQIAAMQKAAAILRHEAAAIEEGHTLGDGDWTGEEEAQAAAAEMLAVAADLAECADDGMFAFRLAHELECVLLDSYGGRWYDSAMAVLSEYRERENQRAEAECPTQFWEPILPHNA